MGAFFNMLFKNPKYYLNKDQKLVNQISFPIIHININILQVWKLDTKVIKGIWDLSWRKELLKPEKSLGLNERILKPEKFL